MGKFDSFELNSRSTKYSASNYPEAAASEADSDAYLLKDKKWTNDYENKIKLKVIQDIKDEIKRKGETQGYR